MKLYYYLFSLLFISSLSQAQTSLNELKKDPNITWVQEYYVNFNPDLSRAALKEHKISGMSQTLKVKVHPYQGKELYDMWEDQNLSLLYKIIRGDFLRNDDVEIYYDDELTKKIPAEEINQLYMVEKKIFTFDPETFQEIEQTIVNEISFDQFQYFQIKLVLYYNKKEMIYSALPLAIGPVIQHQESKGVLFWIPVHTSNITDLDNKDVDWAKRVTYNCEINKSESSSTKNEQKRLKSIGTHISDLNTNYNTVKIYNVFRILGGEQIPPAEVKILGNSVDTIISFSAQTFKEQVSIVTNKLVPEDIKDIRIVQDWYWDYKQKKLYMRFLGSALTIERYDDQGNFLNSGPLFWRRIKSLE